VAGSPLSIDAREGITTMDLLHAAPSSLGFPLPGHAESIASTPKRRILIEIEGAADHAAREVLLDRALGPHRRRKSSEKLRRGRLPAEGLSFVARDADGRLTGTVRLWSVTTGGLHPLPALLLGPLAVEPDLKGTGIGSALMRHAIAEAARLGHGAILLMGDQPYYARFGFSAAHTGKLAMPGPYEPHRFLALELVSGYLGRAAGVLRPTGRPARRDERHAA
jgi:predicted N-acetyltransferase YhbS